MTANRVLISGRIESSRTQEGQRFTILMLPAPDQYSRPESVLVRSKVGLGSVGDTFEGECSLHGYQRRFQMKDQGGTGIEVRMHLEFLG